MVIAVLLLIGAAGYVVYKNHQKSTSTANTSSTTQTSKTSTLDYLVIKEWGVKLSINDPTVPSPVYNAPVTLPDGNEEVVLGSATWDNLTCQGTNSTLNIKSATGAGDELIRGTDKQTVLNDQVVSSDNVVKVGDYYYTYQNNTGIGSSCSLSTADNTTYQSVNQAYTSNWTANKVVAE